MRAENLHGLRPAFDGSPCEVAVSPPSHAIRFLARIINSRRLSACTFNSRNVSSQIEIDPVAAAEWRRECSGFIASFFVHMAMILVLGLMVTPTAERGDIVTIISQPPASDAVNDFAEFEMPELPRELPSAHNKHVDAEATFADMDFESALRGDLELAATDTDLGSPAFHEDGGLEIANLEVLLTAIGQGTNGDGIDADSIGAKVEFYGVKATGRRFVFVTDCSGSMHGAPLQRLKEQLRRSIAALPAQAEFYIVFFNHGAIPMPSYACVRATPQHLDKYLDWSDTVQSDGGTDPSQAMSIALALKPSVVFLLTDGIFQPEPTDAVIGALNEERTTQINTIAIGERGAEPLLQRIAKENKGIYTFVPHR